MITEEIILPGVRIAGGAAVMGLDGLRANRLIDPISGMHHPALGLAFVLDVAAAMVVQSGFVVDLRLIVLFGAHSSLSAISAQRAEASTARALTFGRVDR